jgi:iron complex transport system permease protein
MRKLSNCWRILNKSRDTPCSRAGIKTQAICPPPGSWHLDGASAGLILALILAGLFLLSFVLGRYPISVGQVIRFMAAYVFPVAPDWPTVMETIMVQIRLPRILAAMLVGASQAVAGASFQGLFRNPLVSPDILGVSSGAGFGAALGILLSGRAAVVQLSAFMFSLLAVGTAYGVSRLVKSNPTLSLVLAGVAIGSLFGALLSLLKYVADPIDQLPAITYWLMGSLAAVDNKELMAVSLAILPGITVLMLIRWRLNVLAMGEEEAMALGMHTGRLRAVVVVCCTLITASSVCISGIIGWVGLVIPHIGRILVGPDHKRLLPVSALMGAAYLLLIDDICRMIAEVEVPIGILAAIVGVPFFIYLLTKGKEGWA